MRYQGWYVNLDDSTLPAPGWLAKVGNIQPGGNVDSSPSPAAVPLYAKIADDLRGKIREGYYAPGALLPSRNEIAAMYGVSAITARDALAVLSHEGYARAIRGRGHIVRRHRPRLTVPGRLYDPAVIDGTTLDTALVVLDRADVYEEPAPDNIALPLESGADLVWVRRAVHLGTADRQPVQVHVSWLPGLGSDAGAALKGLDPGLSWPQAVQQVTGRVISAVQQNTRARGANPFEASVFGIPGGNTVLVSHLTAYADGPAGREPVEHSRYAWPTDAVRISDDYAFPQRSGHAPG
jgi:DNA-binding GntR family transcriptional regulator